MKYRTQNRILSFFLALVMLCTSAPFPVDSVETGQQDTAGQSDSSEPVYDSDALSITLNGETVTELELYSYEKLEIRAEGLSAEADYQWQVEHPEQDGVWVNIYDGTEQSISVTMALVSNVLREDGTAMLRCQATAGDYIYLSSPITVTVLQEDAADYSVMPLADDDTSDGDTGEETTEETETPEFVTITIEYWRYDYVKNPDTGKYELSDTPTPAFSSYIATIVYGASFSTTVTVPTIVGYKAYLGDSGDAITQVSLNYAGLTENQTIKVNYQPAEVNYTVRYYFQNIYDDNYVEDTAIMTAAGITEYPVIEAGETGSAPEEGVIKREFSGFTSMFYQPDTIAADGSTVFEVYYERNYYLMDFDCDGGYGADPVYVRYGTYISVPNPVRSGWNFAGWDLTNAWDEDNNTISEDSDGNQLDFSDNAKNTLPETLPCYNTAYKAIWTQDETTYTIAYWLQDGTDKTFLGSRVENATTGEIVSGKDDYFDLKECGIYYEHAHSDSCYDCGKAVHAHHYAHENDCYSFTWQDAVGDSDKSVIQATNNGDTPQNGDIYFIYAEYDLNAGRYWPKIYWDGTYYTISVNGSTSISIANFASIVDGEQIGEIGRSGDLFAIRYKAKTTCGMDLCAADCAIEVHNHDACNMDCDKVEHTHSDSCAAELMKYVLYDGENTQTGIIVEGDGSSVVNVYYKYKIYKIRYVYAKAIKGTGDDYTNFYVAYRTEGGTLETCSWGEVGTAETALPEFKDPDSGKTDRLYFDSDDGTTRYYYISIDAHLGEDISELWPANNKAEVTYGNSTYTWGSWAAEVGTPYRTNNGNNANIIGSYPTMSTEMITADPELLDDGTYLAQNMIAWWGKDINTIGNHSYHNYFEVLAADVPEGVTSEDPKNPDKIDDDYYVRHTYNGVTKVYKLQNDLFQANHDIWTRVDPFEFAGFDVIEYSRDTQSASSSYSNLDTDGNITCSICLTDDCKYCNVFYFDRTPHKLYFWNYNKNLMSGGGSDVDYGTSLQAHGQYFEAVINMDKDYYPSELEPGAYYFDGWYTTPGCLPDTEMDWENTTMPDSDLTVYAKWSPVIHDIYFYYDYEDYQDNEPWNEVHTDGQSLKAEHGTPLNSQDYQNPTKEGYTFIGWFYIDDNGKKRFAPESMEIRRELHLFAEWISSTGEPTTYEVSYVAVDTNGDILGEVAGMTVGYSTAGKTKTFSAKGNTELYEAYRTGYFPETSSHSILMKELDENGETSNTYQFKYVQDDKVWYKVRYVNVATNVEILTATVAFTDHAVITLRYLPIAGYVPMPGYYYQTKALSADYEIGSETNVLEANIITFYYMADEDHGAYSIEYYVEDANGSESYGDKQYTLKTSLTNTADLNQEVTADALTFDGYEFKAASVINFNDDGEAKPETTITTLTDVKGTVDKNGLTIKLYYNRISYAYKIQFLEYGTGNVLGFGKVGDETRHDSDPEANAPFGTEISYTAPADFTIGNTIYEYYVSDATAEQRTDSMTIRAATESSNPNILKFYYTPKQYTVHYVAVCTNPNLTNFGTVSIANERVTTAEQLSGAKATPYTGYQFEGWYSDAACSGTPLSTAATYKPEVIADENDECTFYALFRPITTSLTVKKTVDVSSPTGNFLFSIVGQDNNNKHIDLIVSISGSGSVTVKDLPVGKYVITELTDWSWEYTTTDGSKTLTLTEAAGSVTFANTYVASCWLTAETSCENEFTSVYTPQN